MTTDNRQAVRVTNKILFACHPVSKETFQQIMDDFNNGISLYNRAELADVQVYIGAQSALAKLKDKDEDLGTFLQHLDGKINLLLKKVDKSPSLLDTLVLQRVSIGANGLAFWGDSEFTVNEIVEMQIVLQPEHIFINCFGSVVQCISCESEEDDPSQKYRISVNFQLIMDEDREELIHYNFKQQSLALKRRRLQKECHKAGSSDLQTS